MIDLFSDIVACRENALARLDARVKLLVAVAAIVTVLFSKRPYLPLGLLVLSLAAVLVLRLPVRMLLWRILSPLGFVLVLVALKGLLSGTTPLLEFAPFGWRVTVWAEGAEEGARIGLRVLGAVGVMVLLSAVTPAHRLFHALRWLRFPATWVEIAMLMYRHTFVLLDQAEDIAQAQRVRLGYATPKRALGSVGTLAGAVLVRSLDQSSRTYEAMRLRLYRGHLPFGPLAPLRVAEWALLFGLLALMAGAYLACERGMP